MANPANISNYQHNPKVATVFEKLKSKFGGANWNVLAFHNVLRAGIASKFYDSL